MLVHFVAEALEVLDVPFIRQRLRRSHLPDDLHPEGTVIKLVLVLLLTTELRRMEPVKPLDLGWLLDLFSIALPARSTEAPAA